MFRSYGSDVLVTAVESIVGTLETLRSPSSLPTKGDKNFRPHREPDSLGSSIVSPRTN